jgi:hypothetical protein
MTENLVKIYKDRDFRFLFQAEGRDFIPVGQRKKGQRMDEISTLASPNFITPVEIIIIYTKPPSLAQ